MNFLGNRNNRTLTLVCSLIAIICIYLIQDDSLFRMISSASSDAIGSFEKPEKDVRKKNIANYFWEDLTSRDRLIAGDSIFTGVDSSVIVKLYGGQTILVAPNSLIKFRSKNKKLVIDIPYGAVQLSSVVEDLVISDCGHDFNLAQGQDAVKFKKSEKCGSVTVDTKSAAVTKDFKENKIKKDIKDTFLEVAETGVLGEIENTLSSVQPGSLDSSAGELSAPRFENLDITLDFAQHTTQLLRWSPVANAKFYEIQVSDTFDFAEAEKIKSEVPELTLKKIGSNVFFRGQTFGENSQMSAYSETGKIKVEFPGIKIDKPKISKIYNAKNPHDEGGKENFEVSWSSVPRAENYVIELKDPKSLKTLKKFNSRTPASTIEVPKPGKFSYQVYALDSKGRKISSSDMGQVLYNKVFSILAPVIQENLAEKFYFFQKNSAKYVWLSWIPQGAEQKFRVEIAKDANFTSIIKSAFTSKQKLLVTDQIQQGEYFWRVRAEDKDQFSDWSNTEIFKVKVGTHK